MSVLSSCSFWSRDLSVRVPPPHTHTESIRVSLLVAHSLPRWDVRLIAIARKTRDSLIAVSGISNQARGLSRHSPDGAPLDRTQIPLLCVCIQVPRCGAPLQNVLRSTGPRTLSLSRSLHSISKLSDSYSYIHVHHLYFLRTFCKTLRSLNY